MGIVIDPEYMGGAPALLERRITIATILENIGAGMSLEEIADSYRIPTEAAREACAFASQLIEHQKSA